MLPRPFVMLLIAALTASGVAAQTSASPAPTTLARSVPAQAAGLGRRIAVHFTGTRLDDALKTIAREGSIALSYGSRVVPVERRVSYDGQMVSVREALDGVLRGTGIEVRVVGEQVILAKGSDPNPDPPAQKGSIVGRVTDAKTQTALAGATVVVQGTSRSATTGTDGRYRIADVAPGTYTVRARYIGYAPGSASVKVGADQEATADFTLEKSAQRLDEVVTTGTVVPTEVKALPTPISVITAEDIQRENLQRVDQVFRGQVPGSIAWDQGPRDDYSSVAVRGASALLGVSGLKTFVDGVEEADPQLIATINPNSIERVEITRGPQASTLYGAGALNGVMQIFTKKGQLGRTRPEVLGKVSAGGIGGFDGSSTTLQTDNTASVMGGTGNTSYNLGGSYKHVGEWLPSYNSSAWGVSIGAQTTQGPLTLSGSARYADKSLDLPWDTRLRSYTYYSKPWYQPNRLRQQTYGVTASLQATRSWQHTVTLGYDQNYTTFEQTQPRFTTPADSFLLAYSEHGAKASLLYHTDLRLRLGSAVTSVVTAGVNYDAYDDAWNYTLGATRTVGSLDGTTIGARTPWTNTGYFGQVQVNVAERLFVTGGLRGERNANFGANFGTAWSPRVGAAYLLALGSATVKLRTSYGESIRAPTSGESSAQQTPFNIQLANPALAPERQRGVDGGIDFYLGKASVGVTYYNQRAIDLIQLVTVPTQSGTLPTFQAQNVSGVKNDGWEFETHVPLGPVQVSGTYSVTNSIIQALSADYPRGDYQVGDRVRSVPHTSAGATVTYSPLPRTTVTVSVTHIGHWIENDVLALYGFYFGGQPYRGSQRAYWIEYPTVTKFAVGASQMLTRDLTGFVRAENVGNTLRYEQYNNNIPAPRSVVAGLNVRY